MKNRDMGNSWSCLTSGLKCLRNIIAEDTINILEIVSQILSSTLISLLCKGPLPALKYQM